MEIVYALFFSLIDGLFQDCGNSRTKHNSASWNPGKLLSMHLRRCLILTTFTFTSSHTSLIIPAYRVPLHQVQNTAVAGGMDPKRRFPLSGSSDEVNLLHVGILPLKLQYSTNCFQCKAPNLQCGTPITSVIHLFPGSLLPHLWQWVIWILWTAEQVQPKTSFKYKI